MPVYEYRCHRCNRHFSEFHRSLTGVDPVRCPDCESENVERLLSVFAARHGVEHSTNSVSPGGCGRCGDPNGPCAS